MLKSFIESVLSYIIRLLIALDQLGNTLLGGRPDHTISGRVGHRALQGKRFYLLMEIVIDNIFFWDEHHCFNAIEWDEVEKPLYRIKL